MILGFKNTFPDGQETRFITKIISGKKIHTLREGDRWNTGYSIQMATGVRTKEYQQFNISRPDLSICKSVQDVFMTYFRGILEVTIDDHYMYWSEIESLIQNDGLTREQFINWFFPKGTDVWRGQIIHWTDFKY